MSRVGINGEAPNKILLESTPRSTVRYGPERSVDALCTLFPLPRSLPIFLQFYVLLGTLDLMAFLDRNFRVLSGSRPEEPARM